MNAIRRGWCPSVFEPMASGDGLLVRIKPRLATITADQARAIAAASRQFGNGVLSLTNRGNLQLRGLREENLDALAGTMIDAGLVSADPALERVRNIIVSPLVGDDPAIAPGTADVAVAIETLLRDFPDLRAKFSIVVDGGGVLPLDDVRGDIIVRARVRAVTPSLSAVGRIEYADRAAFGIAAPFGMLRAETFHALADIAESHGDGTLRISPWRATLFTGIRACVAKACKNLGLIIDPADPRLNLIACPGAPSCAQATVPTNLDIVAKTRVHISGCAKGCAHPAAAPITLVGRDGRYDMVREGRAGDTPMRRGLTLAEACAEVAA